MDSTSSTATLADAVGARRAGAAGDPEVASVTLRAQSAGPGSLFAALAGHRVHGARFAADAVDAGAVAVFTDPEGLDLLGAVADRVPVLVHDHPRDALGELSALVAGRPSEDLTLVGITGTSGKTTSSYFVEAVLEGVGRVAGRIGTTGSAVAGELVPSALTTPEAPEFQSLLAMMAARGADSVVTEVSSHALRLGRVDGTRFAVGVFLNLTREHLEFHPDMEDYFRAKCRLFDAAADPGSRVRPAERAVVVVDDDWGRRVHGLRPDAVTVSGQVGGTADWTAGEAEITAEGTQRFTATGPDTRLEVEIPLLGRFNIANALVALAVADVLELDLTAAARSLAHVRVPGRLEPIDRGQDFRVFVDYAHKAAAVEAVLESVRPQTTGRIGIVIGAGGERDVGKRPLMGAASARHADLVVVTDDNPHFEDPALIRAAVIEGARQEAAVKATEVDIRESGDRRAAIAAAVEWARPGDTLVIAGKGHETGQDVAGTVEPFDDRVVSAEELDRVTGRQGDPA